MTYDGIESKCSDKGGRLCYFHEICPHGGPNKAPVGGQKAKEDMWAPIRSSQTDASPNWVQIGNRVGGMCNKLTVYHAADKAGYWMVTNQDVSWKRIYPCCPLGKKSVQGVIIQAEYGINKRLYTCDANN